MDRLRPISRRNLTSITGTPKDVPVIFLSKILQYNAALASPTIMLYTVKNKILAGELYCATHNVSISGSKFYRYHPAFNNVSLYAQMSRIRRKAGAEIFPDNARSQCSYSFFDNCIYILRGHSAKPF